MNPFTRQPLEGGYGDICDAHSKPVTTPKAAQARKCRVSKEAQKASWDT